MIPLYRYSGGDRIEIKEAIRETEHFWIFPNGKESKAPSNYRWSYGWHRTPQKAIKVYLGKMENIILNYRNSLSEAEKQYAVAKEQLAILEETP